MSSKKALKKSQKMAFQRHKANNTKNKFIFKSNKFLKKNNKNFKND